MRLVLDEQKPGSFLNLIKDYATVDALGMGIFTSLY